ncbi:MAG: guanylate kinase [Gammaproteobacteria bacterium]|nr:guanylate kinase [Gammaproteobacteria bacterium]
MNSQRHGTLFVVSAPSGTGKTSIVRAALDRDAALTVSVSYTTRPQRGAEQNGRDYQFIDVPTFEHMLEQGEFLEHAEVFGHYYGTSGSWVRGQLDAGLDVVLEIDWHGAQQVRHALPESVAVFVLPPSRKALKERLKARGEDDRQVIEERLKSAISEMAHYVEYDYLIVNEDFDQAVERFLAVVVAQRQHIGSQQMLLAPLLRELLSEG